MRMSTVETWLGPFTVVVDRDGAVLASGWTAEAGDLLPLIHPSLRGDRQTGVDLGDAPRRMRDLGAVTRAVRAYHDGEGRVAVDVEILDVDGSSGRTPRQHRSLGRDQAG